MKILLVDDEREEREGISWLIKKYKYPLEIVQAANGKEALQCIEKYKIDILFTDVKMPVMNGLELAKEVYKRWPEVKIIIYSAYGEFDYAKQALEANAVSYLLKPIEIEEFQKLMVSVIQAIRVIKRELKQNAKSKSVKIYFIRYLIELHIAADDREKVNQILFEQSNTGCKLLDVEFAENFFEEHEELFTHFLKMYMGKNVLYFNMYPNEAYLLVQEKKYLTGNQLEEQAEKLLMDLHKETHSEAVMIISDLIDNDAKLEEQLVKIHKIQSEIFGYDNQIIRVKSYYSETEYYASDVESAGKKLEQAFASMDLELIKKQNELLKKTILSLDKVSKLYLQNILYSIIKSLYDKSPKIKMEEVLASSERMFRAKNAKTMLEIYGESIDKMLDSLAVEKQDELKDYS